MSVGGTEDDFGVSAGQTPVMVALPVLLLPSTSSLVVVVEKEEEERYV